MKHQSKQELIFTHSIHVSGKEQYIDDRKMLRIAKDKKGFWRGYFRQPGSNKWRAAGWVIFENENEALEWIANSRLKRISQAA